MACNRNCKPDGSGVCTVGLVRLTSWVKHEKKTQKLSAGWHFRWICLSEKKKIKQKKPNGVEKQRLACLRLVWFVLRQCVLRPCCRGHANRGYFRFTAALMSASGGVYDLRLKEGWKRWEDEREGDSDGIPLHSFRSGAAVTHLRVGAVRSLRTPEPPHRQLWSNAALQLHTSTGHHPLLLLSLCSLHFPSFISHSCHSNNEVSQREEVMKRLELLGLNRLSPV